MPGEGNEQQALHWQVSDDRGLTWSAPAAPLPPVEAPDGQRLPMWSPVLHTHVRQETPWFSMFHNRISHLPPYFVATGDGVQWAAPAQVEPHAAHAGVRRPPHISQTPSKILLLLNQMFLEGVKDACDFDSRPSGKGLRNLTQVCHVHFNRPQQRRSTS